MRVRLRVRPPRETMYLQTGVENRCLSMFDVRPLGLCLRTTPEQHRVATVPLFSTYTYIGPGADQWIRSGDAGYDWTRTAPYSGWAH